MKSLLRMRQFVKPYWKLSVLALVLLLGMVAADLLIPRLTQKVIDDGVARQDMKVILTTSLLMLGAAFVSTLFAIANTVVSVRVGQNIGADLRSSIVRKVQTFSFGNLDRIQTGQLLVRTTSDVNQVQTIVMMSLRILTRAPLWMLGSIAMLILTSPRLAAMVSVLLLLIVGLAWLLVTRTRPLFLTIQQKLDKLNQVLQENLAGVHVVKAFVRVKHENVRFDRANRDLMAQTINAMRFLAVLLPTMTAIVNLGVVGVIWFGGNLAIGGRFTAGEIVASVNYLTSSLFPMAMLGMMMGPLSAADASAGRILDILDSSVEVQNRPQAQALSLVLSGAKGDEQSFAQRDGLGPRGRIAFENVCFSYHGAGGEEAVLKNINLVAEPGEQVAILGATGSGKSSLIHLIPRFYDVTGGRVTWDGVDVRDLPLSELRAQVGIALQETVLFSGTIRDNIRYGRPDATEEEVIAAAKVAQAHDFIMAFPDGYDTVVGQRGANLSGGQKQRIAIARALLVQPKVLILDDSTSAVDVETESKIQAALDELKVGRTNPSAKFTSFVIAQRISTVLNADKIVVLDKGQIAAVGTHTELMASSPIYREIYQSQLGDGGGRNG